MSQLQNYFIYTSNYLYQLWTPSFYEKKKSQILKIINKNQPKALRSALQNNEFNHITIQQYIHYPITKLTPLQPATYTKQRLIDKLSTNSNFTMYKSKYPVISAFFLGQDIVTIENLNRQPIRNLSNEQQITIKCLQLQKYHLVGQLYEGQSSLCYYSKKQPLYRIRIHDDICFVKKIMNRVGMVTGKGQIIIISLALSTQITTKQYQQYQINNQIRIKQKDTIFSTFEWITPKNYNSQIIVGSTNGKIIIYNILQNNLYYCYRVIPHAHFQQVTTIKQCPLLSTNQSVIFASGSFDGCLKIWDISQQQYIYAIEICNKKIVNLVWDSGAKFIFVVRDQAQQNCMIICFYSINRTSVNLCLGSEVQLRMIKATGTSFIVDGCTNIIPIINTINGCITIYKTQQLRKNSLKKKKNNQSSNNHYQVQLPQQKHKQHNFPIISDFKYQIIQQNHMFIGSTYNNYFFTFKLNDKEIMNE